MKQETDSIIMLAGFAAFAVALVAGGALLAKKQVEAHEREAANPPDPALALEVEHALAVNGFDAEGNFVGPGGTLEDVAALEQVARKAEVAGLPTTASELREIAERARARF